MNKMILKLIIISTACTIMIACHSTNRSTIKKQEKMFTVEQVNKKLSQVRSGADFPVLAMNLKNLGVTYYETRMEDGRSIFHGKDGYKVYSGPKYESIIVADKVNLEQLKTDIAHHQQGKSDYAAISRQSANNGIEKWAVCLIAMTCTYVDKAGNKVWVEQIPNTFSQNTQVTLAQIKEAHSQVKSGADFPAYIQDIKKLGVTYYETFVTNGNSDYYGADKYRVSTGARYADLAIAETSNIEQFKIDLKAHQQGKTDFPAFCKDGAKSGVEKWVICIEKMTCTYYNKAGNEMLVEEIPQ